MEFKKFLIKVYKDIRAFWNADLELFVRANTAEEILDALASYCRRIHDSSLPSADWAGVADIPRIYRCSLR